jgi:glycine cleavage system H protein
LIKLLWTGLSDGDYRLKNMRDIKCLLERRMSKTTPPDRLFSEEHEWVKIEAEGTCMGISDHAQAALGDVVYIELPEVGSVITKGKAIGVVESVKAVSDIYAPISGVVKAVNPLVIEHPEQINQDPYGEGWLLQIEPSDQSEADDLLSPSAYQDLLDKEA